MSFDKEIKSAQKLVDQWVKESEKVEAFFIGLKKENLKWEKDEIKAIEELIKANKTKEATSRIEGCRRAIQDQHDEALTRHKRHTAFVLGEPREGVAGICRALKLTPKTPVYEAVAKAMEKSLIESTKQFSKTGDVWSQDLLPKIKIFLNKLDSLEKMSTTFKSHNLVYLKQLKKDVEQFQQDIADRISELKVTMAEIAIKKIVEEPNSWVTGNPKMRRDQFDIFNARVTATDQLAATAEKNRGRILKSIPDEFKTQSALLEVISGMEKEWKKSLLEIKEVQGKFKIAVAYCKKAFPQEFN